MFLWVLNKTDYHEYYICHCQGLVDTQTLPSEHRTRYHIEAKMAADGNPMILSANVTRGMGRKTSFSATVKNVFRETASLSGVQLTQSKSHHHQKHASCI